MMTQEHQCLTTQIDERDYLLGSTSSIVYKVNVPSGNWKLYLDFFERQMFSFDVDGCTLFSAQESMDAQIEFLIQTGQISAQTIKFFTDLGFMDSVNSRDSLPHFHSSPRYLQCLTGNGYNGNPLQAPWDTARKYGIVPWLLYPFNSLMTQDEYIATPPQNVLDVGAKFLAGIGGKDSFQYQWVYPIGSGNIDAMKRALMQSPLCLGVPVGSGWNQDIPPIPDNTRPAHSVQSYLVDSMTDIQDHYAPEFKQLIFGYPIPQCLQGVIQVSPPPLPPVLPTNPTVKQESAWLTALKAWLHSILSTLNGNKG